MFWIKVKAISARDCHRLGIRVLCETDIVPKKYTNPSAVRVKREELVKVNRLPPKKGWIANCSSGEDAKIMRPKFFFCKPKFGKKILNEKVAFQ